MIIMVAAAAHRCRWQVVIQTKGSIEAHSDAAILEVVADGARKAAHGDGDDEEDQWRRNGGWLLVQLTPAQRREGPSFVSQAPPRVRLFNACRTFQRNFGRNFPRSCWTNAPEICDRSMDC
jgi:hypothetical protein